MTICANQQVTSIGWFVGILEGEGSFRNTRGNNAEIRIVNTNVDIITACENFLKQNNIYFVTGQQRLKSNKIISSISIRNSLNQFYNYPEVLYKLVDSKLECRNTEYQRILGTSETIRLPSIDLDWLIGIFEAEASFSLTKCNRGQVHPRINISNTNLLIVDKIIKNLQNLECAVYIKNKQKANNNCKEIISIDISGMKRCLRFLDPTHNLWVAKRNLRRTSLMMEFINSRFSKNQKEAYTVEELQIVQSMTDLNR